MKPRRTTAKHRTPAMPRMAAGAGLKAEHADDIFAGPQRVDFFEIHAENYMGDGGPPHRLLERIRTDYPLSIHGVGASIGGGARLDAGHLGRLRRLVDIYQPALFSEHLAWSSHDGAFFNDLLPLPYTKQTLAYVCDHIDELQNAIGMRMLLENPSHYVAFGSSTIAETDFLRAIVRRTGCGLLLDVNNVHVSAVNRRFNAESYIDAFPVESVAEIHLAGFAEDRDAAGQLLLIDHHGQSVDDTVWRLYHRALSRAGTVPTLVEWDNNVPLFAELAAEVARVRAALLDHTGTLAA